MERCVAKYFGFLVVCAGRLKFTNILKQLQSDGGSVVFLRDIDLLSKVNNFKCQHLGSIKNYSAKVRNDDDYMLIFAFKDAIANVVLCDLDIHSEGRKLNVYYERRASTHYVMTTFVDVHVRH